MALGGYDGSIRIDTSVNAQGMNKGTKNITAQLTGIIRTLKILGSAVGIAFSGAAIFSFSKNVLNAFDLMGSSAGGNIKAIQTAIEGLKGAFANLLVTAIIALTPYIISLINFLTRLLTILTAIVRVLFNVKEGMGAVAQNTTKAGKAAKGALASFDQLNVLQKNESGSEGEGKLALPTVEIPQSMLDKIQEFKDKVMGFLQPIIDVFKALWVATLPLIQLVWESFLKPLGQWAADKVVAGIQWLTEKLEALATWIRENPEQFRKIVIIVGMVVLAIAALIAIVYLAVLAFTAIAAAIEFVIGLWAVLVSIVAFLATPVGLLILAIIALIAMIVLLISKWQMITDVVKLVVDTTILALKVLMIGIMKDFIIPFNNAFFTMLDGLKEKFRSIFEWVKTFIKGVINTIIDYINGMIQSIMSGMNAVIGGANLAASLTGGGTAIISPLSVPQIPRLAKGAVIPPNAQFAAILGDQRNGKNLEAPAAMFEQMLERAAQSSGGGEITINMPVYLDGEKIYENQKKIQRRRGNNLIKGA